MIERKMPSGGDSDFIAGLEAEEDVKAWLDAGFPDYLSRRSPDDGLVAMIDSPENGKGDVYFLYSRAPSSILPGAEQDAQRAKHQRMLAALESDESLSVEDADSIFLIQVCWNSDDADGCAAFALDSHLHYPSAHFIRSRARGRSSKGTPPTTASSSTKTSRRRPTMCVFVMKGRDQRPIVFKHQLTTIIHRHPKSGPAGRLRGVGLQARLLVERPHGV